MRAYLRVDPELAEKKGAYPDGAFVAFVSTLCAAEQQPHRGRFKTPKILRAYLGKHSRWIKFLLAKRDLIELETGVLYVDGWDEWQEGDWKVAERVSRIRSRQKVTVRVTPDVTVPVTAGTVNTLGNPPLTLPDSPQRRMAVGVMATSVSLSETSGVEDSSLESGNNAVLVGANGSTPPDPWSTASASTLVGKVMDWFCLWRGWSQVKADTRRDLELDARAIVALGITGSQMHAWLDELAAIRDRDQVNRLSYFWQPIQDLQQQELKNHRARSGGLTRIGEVLPASVHRDPDE